VVRAWLLHRPADVAGQPLVLAESPEPRPGPGQVRLRIEACGVCRTDLHTVEGDLDLPVLPIVPGHQVVGVVDAVGAGVEGVRRGERRGVYWLYQACGRCGPCRRGEENLCERPEFTGLHRNGGYAEAIVAPAAFTVPIPDTFSAVEAAPLLCAGVIGYRSLRLSRLRRGERLALFGFGASAHLVIQVARYWGCDVVVYTRSPAHQRLARTLGATWAGPAPLGPGASGAEPVAPSQPGGPPEADRAIIFAPAGELVPAALRAVRPGGTVAINAIHMTDIPSFPYRLIYGERTLLSVANVTRRDAEEFMRLAAEIPVRTEVRVYPFSEANLALRDLKSGAVGGAAVLAVAQETQSRKG